MSKREIANLFVPDNAPNYEKLYTRHRRTEDSPARTDRRVCVDGVTRSGVWVPLGWWDEVGTARSSPENGLGKFFSGLPTDLATDEENEPVTL